MTEKTDLRTPVVRVDGLPTFLGDGAFARWLTALGVQVDQMLIVRDVAGNSQGYAFICVSDHQAAERIAERINASRLRNRVLSASLGQDRPQRKTALKC